VSYHRGARLITDRDWRAFPEASPETPPSTDTPEIGRAPKTPSA
jgi:hypothetical protein